VGLYGAYRDSDPKRARPTGRLCRRALDGGIHQYKLPGGFRKALELFNLQRACGTGSRTVMVVEGYFDCMQVPQAGFPLGGWPGWDRLFRRRRNPACSVTLSGLF